MKDLSAFREEYTRGELRETEMMASPIEQFQQWMQMAIDKKISEPNAMTLATAGKNGRPSARIVLLKEVNNDGFVFYTNYMSKKGRDLEENPFAALIFDWHILERQVRIEGCVEKLPAEVSDQYFDSRPESSKLGAWVSPQSKVIRDRAELDNLEKETELSFEDQPIPRPPHWGGYLLRPTMIEFWQGRPSRLHDRIVYYFENEKWDMRRLAP